MIGARRNPIRVHKRKTEIDFVSDQFDKFGVFVWDHLSLIVVCQLFGSDLRTAPAALPRAAVEIVAASAPAPNLLRETLHLRTIVSLLTRPHQSP